MLCPTTLTRFILIFTLLLTARAKITTVMLPLLPALILFVQCTQQQLPRFQNVTSTFQISTTVGLNRILNFRLDEGSTLDLVELISVLQIQSYDFLVEQSLRSLLVLKLLDFGTRGELTESSSNPFGGILA